MKFKPTFYTCFIFYFLLIMLSGLVLDLIPVISASGRYYYTIKIFHKNLFFYGIVLNIFPIILTYLEKNFQGNIGESYRSLLRKVFPVYQIVLLAALGVNTAGYIQSSDFFEFVWIFDIILLPIIGFYVFLLFKLSTSSMPATILKNYYLAFPLTLVLVYYIINNIVKPAGFVSSVPVFSSYVQNLFTAGFRYHLYNYFIPLFFFGIVYTKFSQNNEISGSLLVSIRIQWLLHLVFSSIGLYFYLKYLAERELGPWEKTGLLAAYIPFFAGIINLRILKKDSAGRTPGDMKYLGTLGFFLQVYVLGQIIGDFNTLRGLFLFTNWTTAQVHVASAAILAPAVLHLLFSGAVFEHQNRILPFWVYSVLVFSIASWILGTVEAGVWYKEGAYRFLEFPGWISVMETLYPIRLIRLAIGLVVFGAISGFIIKNKNVLNMSDS